MSETKVTLKIENHIIETEVSASADLTGKYDHIPLMAHQLAAALYSQIEPLLNASNEGLSDAGTE